jgi:hypothetical protein
VSGNSNIIDIIKKVAENEVKKLHINELGIVTSIFPHSSEGDKDNYECNVRLRDKDVELRKVPVATQHIGLASIVHTGDLVLISFINGDINSPVIIGRLYNDEDRPPSNKEEEIIYKPSYATNKDLKRFNVVLPEGTVNITLHDDRIDLIIGKSSMHINDKGEINLKTNPSSGKKCEITMNSAGVALSTDYDINLNSKSNIIVRCDGDLSFNAKKNITMESGMAIKIKSGATLDAQSTAPITVKSNTMANIESTGPMTIKGAIVNINP